MLPRKARDHLAPTLAFLDQENIPYEITHAGKHGCLVLKIGNRTVKWFFAMSPSDGRSTLNFRAQVRRVVQRHRENISSKETV